MHADVCATRDAGQTGVMTVVGKEASGSGLLNYTFLHPAFGLCYRTYHDLPELSSFVYMYICVYIYMCI